MNYAVLFSPNSPAHAGAPNWPVSRRQLADDEQPVAPEVAMTEEEFDAYVAAHADDHAAFEQWQSDKLTADENRAAAIAAAKNAARNALGGWFASLPIGEQVAFEPARAAIVLAIELGDMARVVAILQTYPLPSSIEGRRSEALSLLH